MLMAAPAPVRAAEQPSGTVIRAIQIITDGPVTRVIVDADGPLPLPRSDALTNPPRIYFDLAGVTHNLKGTTFVPKGGVVSGVRIGLRPEKATRVVLDLTRPENYRINADEHQSGRLWVLIGRESEIDAALISKPVAPAPKPAVPAPKPAVPAPTPAVPTPAPAVSAPAPAVPANSSSSAAQDSRAAEVAAQQADKATKLRPNAASGTEKALEWFEGHVTDPSTLYVRFGGLYPSAGFASGLGYRHAVGHARFNLSGAYSARGYKGAEVSLKFPELAGDKLEIETQVSWDDATQVPFYGVGNDSSKEARVNYGLESLEAGALVAFEPVSWFRIGAGYSLRDIEDRAGVGRRPSIETFPAPPALLFQKTRFAQTQAFTAIDWRESSGYTRRGGLYSVTWSDYKDADDHFNFQRIDAEIQQSIPILKEHWVFAFRGLLRTTEVKGGQDIPYYMLPTLGGARLHRGYSDFRFQDRHVMLLSAEYRWIPSRVVDMAFFVDSGKLAAERRDLDLENLKTAYGIGFRIHGPTFTPFRLDVARGDEGIRVHLTGGIAF